MDLPTAPGLPVAPSPYPHLLRPLDLGFTRLRNRVKPRSSGRSRWG